VAALEVETLEKLVGGHRELPPGGHSIPGAGQYVE
jgi:hypothetical protein